MERGEEEGCTHIPTGPGALGKEAQQWSNVAWCTFEEDVIALVRITTIMVQLAWKCASNSCDNVSERRRELEMLPGNQRGSREGVEQVLQLAGVSLQLKQASFIFYTMVIGCK